MEIVSRPVRGDDGLVLELCDFSAFTILSVESDVERLERLADEERAAFEGALPAPRPRHAGMPAIRRWCPAQFDIPRQRIAAEPRAAHAPPARSVHVPLERVAA